MINHNLLPETRVKKRNTVISDTKQQKDFNSLMIKIAIYKKLTYDLLQQLV